MVSCVFISERLLSLSLSSRFLVVSVGLSFVLYIVFSFSRSCGRSLGFLFRFVLLSCFLCVVLSFLPIFAIYAWFMLSGFSLSFFLSVQHYYFYNVFSL